MIRTKYREKRRDSVNVEKEAEFEKVITHEFYTLGGIFLKFRDYKFTEYIDEFREEFNCQSKCEIKYFLIINSGRRGLYFGRFLGSVLRIPNRNRVEFLAFPSFDDRGNSTEEVNNILQNEVYDCVKVKAFMEIKFLLFCSLDALTEYEEEQVEDLYDEGDDEPPTIETPFVSDECSICLTAKPNIIIIPCLHQSFCSQCEETGKLTKCPTCREKINRKIKI